jgi:hypothetical protein
VKKLFLCVFLFLCMSVHAFVYLFAHVNCFISICSYALFRDFGENDCMCVSLCGRKL